MVILNFTPFLALLRSKILTTLNQDGLLFPFFTMDVMLPIVGACLAVLCLFELLTYHTLS